MKSIPYLILTLLVVGLAEAQDFNFSAHVKFSSADKEEKKEQEKGYVRTERRHGTFSRQFRVPTTVQADSLKAGVKDGVLTIEVPKGTEQGARKVPVA